MIPITNRTTSSLTRSINLVELAKILRANHLASSPIKLVRDSFNSGQNIVCLSDPHPYVNESERYSLFLTSLIEDLAKNAGLKKIFLELKKHLLESKIDPLARDWESWISKGNNFNNYLLKRKELDERASLEDDVSPIGPGGVKNAGGAFSIQPHWIPLISTAKRLGISIHLYDPRGSNKSNLSIKKVLSSEVERVSYETILGDLNLRDPLEKVLVIGGAAHFTNSKELNRLGRRLIDIPNLRTTTINVLVGWQDLLDNDYEITKALLETDINSLVLDTSSIKGFEDLVFLRTYEEVDLLQQRDMNLAPIKILASEFDKFIFFRTPEQIPISI